LLDERNIPAGVSGRKIREEEERAREALRAQMQGGKKRKRQG